MHDLPHGPRAKLYLLLLANLMLLFHVGTGAEAATTALCLLLFFLSGKARAGMRLSVLYFGLLAVASLSCLAPGRACC